MKKIIAITLIIIMVISLAACGQSEPAKTAGATAEKTNLTFTFNGAEHTVLPYYPIEDNYVMTMVNKGYKKFNIYDSKTLTAEMLTNRTNLQRTIVERVIGIVTNEEREGDGRVLNQDNEHYYYISYSGCDFEYTTGTIIVTYLMYNPNTNYEDDIIERYDYILDKKFED
jgi:hypothetical protein